MVQTVEHPTIGTMPTVRLPITFNNAELASSGAPPLKGADTEAVLRELGYGDERIAQLMSTNLGQHE